MEKTDTERMDWLAREGMARLVGHRSGGVLDFYEVRLNVGATIEHPWRYSEPLKSLREACDFGIANPLTTP